MDTWFSEGRVSADCQLLKQGGTQWQWAAELYPALSQLAAASSSPSGVSFGSMSSGGPAAISSPLTPLSSATRFADPPGLSPLGPSAPTSSATLPSYTTGTAPSYSSPLASPAFSANPYATSASAGSYGGYQQRSGPHPMVIVTGIFQILFACWNFVYFAIAIVLALIFLGGGAAFGIAGANAQEQGAQGAAGVIAALGAMGAVFAALLGIAFLIYGILQVTTAIGLFKRRQWARVASLVYGGFGIILLLWYLLFSLAFDPVSIISLIAEMAYVVVVFIAMCLPDATRDFR
jgi:hypothetical protein